MNIFHSVLKLGCWTRLTNGGNNKSEFKKKRQRGVMETYPGAEIQNMA